MVSLSVLLLTNAAPQTNCQVMVREVQSPRLHQLQQPELREAEVIVFVYYFVAANLARWFRM